MAPFVLHPSYILREGLELCRLSVEVQARLEKNAQVRMFKAHFGRHPLHLSRVYRDLQVAGLMTEEEAKQKGSFIGFLLANNFLRCYDEDDRRYSRFSEFMSRDDMVNLTEIFLNRIFALKEWKIKCPSQWPVRMGASADGTHARINEPRDPEVRRNPKKFSFKHNFAGLTWLIVLSLWTNDIWYATAGDPASTHDMTMVREEFLEMIPEGCRVVSDSAFSGKTDEEKAKFSVVNALDSDEVKEMKARAKARHETINTKMKFYKCLAERGRHLIEKHKRHFGCCLVLCQYAIEDTSEVGEPLMTI